MENHLQLFLETVSIQDKDAFLDRHRYSALQKVTHFKTKQWQNEKKAVLFLWEQPLFDRLRKNKVSAQEFMRMLPHLQVVEKAPGEIVFNDYEHVHIVLNGRILLRFHEEDPLEFQYIA